jgi:hypothetical protein
LRSASHAFAAAPGGQASTSLPRASLVTVTVPLLVASLRRVIGRKVGPIQTCFVSPGASVWVPEEQCLSRSCKQSLCGSTALSFYSPEVNGHTPWKTLDPNAPISESRAGCVISFHGGCACVALCVSSCWSGSW